MPRGLHANLKQELGKDSLNLCTLVFIDLGSGIRLTDYGHDITHSGSTYTSSEHLLDVGAPKESRDLRVNTVSIQLSGVEQTYISLFLSSDYVNRQVLVYKAAIDSAGGIIGEPMISFDGRLVRYEITERSGSSELLIEAASHWADFEKKSGRLTNNNSQQFYFPNDLGFEYAASTIRDLKWGRK